MSRVFFARNFGNDGPGKTEDRQTSQSCFCSFTTTTSPQKSQRKEGNGSLTLSFTFTWRTSNESIYVKCCCSNLPQGRKSRSSSKASEPTSDKPHPKKTKEILKLKSQYGVDAWKRWIQWRQTQPDLKKPRFGSMSRSIFSNLNLLWSRWDHPCPRRSTAGTKGGSSALHHSWAQLRSVLLCHWGETAQRRTLLPWQPVLPLPRDSKSKPVGQDVDICWAQNLL